MRIHLKFTAIFLAAGLGAHAADRITSAVDTSRTTVLRGQVHPLAQPRYDQGLVAPGTPIQYATVFLQPSPGLDEFLKTYRPEQKLSPEQFADRFGLSRNDVAKVTKWLTSQGLKVHDVGRGRHWVTFSGTAAQVGQALHTEIHRYVVNGTTHFANASEPSIPLALQNVVAGFTGLDDFLPTPPVRGPIPDYNYFGQHMLAPGDLAAIYDLTPLYNAGIDGSGQTIVIVGQSDPFISDVTTYRSGFGLPSNNPETVLVGTDPGVNFAALAEADLDMQVAGAIAPNASIEYVYSTSALTAIQYAVDQNLGQVISVSFGFCEAQAPTYFRTVIQQANAQGITVVASSGDAGAVACDRGDPTPQASSGPSVAWPASLPEVTSVGGTEFNEGSGVYWQARANAAGGTALSYIPEVAWNDNAALNSIGEATGGGPSMLYSKPAWQAGQGVPNDNARDTPDISFSGSIFHDAYATILEGGVYPGGGTSASTPLFSGVVALLNQYAMNQGFISTPGLGNINPSIYALAQTAPNAFHDIVDGNNDAPCAQSTLGCVDGVLGYTAGPGYDLATGLGSLDINNFVTQWKPGAAPAIRLGLSPDSGGLSDPVQLTVTVTGAGATPTGSISFLLDVNGLGSMILGTAPLQASNAAGVATAVLSSNGAQLATGTGTIQALYGGDATYGGGAASATFTLKPPAGAGSMVVPFVTPNPVPERNGTWPYQAGLTEIAGVATTVTSFTIDGVNQNLKALSSTNIPPHGTVWATLEGLLLAVPLNRQFIFTGKDASGKVWVQQLSVPFLASPAGTPTAAISLTTASPVVPQSPAGSGSCAWPQQLTLPETGGFEELLIAFTVNGANSFSQAQTTFGATRLAPFGILQGNLCAAGPGPLTVSVTALTDSGTEAGAPTSQLTTTLSASTASALFMNPPAQSSYTLSVTDATQTPSPVSIPVGFSSGSPAWNVTVGPANPTTAWLTVNPISGKGAGSVTVSATPTGLSPGAYTAFLTFSSPSAAQTLTVPVTLVVGASGDVSVGGITNNFSGGLTAAPGMMTAVYGINMAPAGSALSAPGLPLPLTLGGVSATVNGVTAPLYYVSPGQIDLQIPYETSAGTAILAINNNGQVATFAIPVAVTAPGLYPSAVSATTGLAAGSAPLGATLFLFMTGEGDVTPTLATGATPNPTSNTSNYPKPRLPLTVTLGGVPITPLFQAIPYGLAGAAQINLTVPFTAQLGPQQLVVSVGGVAAPPVNLTVTAH